MIIHPDDQDRWTDHAALTDLMHRFSAVLDGQKASTFQDCVGVDVHVQFADGTCAEGLNELSSIASKEQSCSMSQLGTLWLNSLTQLRAEIASYVVRHTIETPDNTTREVTSEGLRQVSVAVRVGARWLLVSHEEVLVWRVKT